MADGDVLIEVPKFAQHNPRCCWYACYMMLYAYRDKGLTAADVRPRLQAVGISTEDPLYENQWERAAAALGLSGMSVSHLAWARNMRWCLAKCGPIWTAGDFFEDSAAPHAVVISGIYADNKLRLSDPYEFYFRDIYRYMTYAAWRSKVRVAPFACQLWW